MSDYGLKVSLPGYDVNTATPEQCAIHSGYASPKVKIDATPRHYGTVRITFAADTPNNVDTAVYTVPHGYGYTPMVLAQGTYSDGMSGYDGTLPLAPTATFEVYTAADNTNMYIVVFRNVGWGSIVGHTLTVSYQIFAENGA